MENTKYGRNLFVGTSGWSYKHWAQGVFYPRGLKQSDWLAYYATHFCTVEVNMTFYRLPHTSMLQRWYRETPDGFCFAIKLWRRITHEKRLKNCVEDLCGFFETLAPLRPKWGPLLVQLPPSMSCDLTLLDEFLHALQSVSCNPEMKTAFEFRNPSWINQRTLEVLCRYGAALCIADMPRSKTTEPNEVDFVYVRRHGPKGNYRSSYDEGFLRAEASRIQRWLQEGKCVYVYFNNDIDGFAVENAKQLQKFVEAEAAAQYTST